VLLASLQRAYSFSAATGSCFGGNANVFGPHVINFGSLTIQTGSLAAGGLQVLFDGVPLTTDGVFSFNEGRDYSIRVVGENDYKGLLIRLETTEDVDTTAALVEDSDLLSPAWACTAPVVGLDHNSAVLKNNEGGTLRLNGATDLTLDITVVNILDDTDSIFYYSQFTLEALPAPSEPPSLAPSMAPSTTPTISIQPSFVPTGVPSGSPSAEPSVNPSAAASATPSIAPTSLPSTTPSVAPTSTPSTVPSLAPSATPSIVPTSTPSTVPSLAPSVTPSIAPTSLPSTTPSVVPTSTPSKVPSLAPSATPSIAPTSLPSTPPSVAPSSLPTRAPTDLPSQSPTKSSQPSVFCVAEGDTCDFDDTCCGDGANVCVGVCTRVRVIGLSSKNLDSSQYKLSDGGRIRGSGGVRRKLLKGSGTKRN
jgi:hypothetical protein